MPVGRVRRSGAGGAPLFSGFTVPVLMYCRGDLGITLGTGVAAWADQSGNGNHWSQGTGASQPAYTAGALNGIGVLTGDGVDDVLNCSLNLPAPGTTPTTVLGVFRQVGWTAGRRWFGSTADNNISIEQRPATPNARTFNGVNGAASAGAVIASWVRLIAEWTNNTTDRLVLAGMTGTGVNTGNSASTGRQLFASAGASFCALECAEIVVLGGLQSAPVLAAYDAYIATTYGGLVGV